MAEKKIIDVEVRESGLDELNTDLKKTDSSIKDVGNSSSSAMGLLDKMTGGAVTKIRGAITAVKGFNITLKATKTAIIATGIGALIVALGSLYTWFSKTQAGADKLNQIMAAMGAAFDVVIDRVSQIGSGLADFFSGNFAEGFDKIKDSVAGLNEELTTEIALAWQLAAQVAAVDKAEVSLILTHAKKRRQIEELRFASKDENKSLKDRAELLKQAQQLDSEILADQLRFAEQRAAISQADTKRANSTTEQLRENAEIQARVEELKTESLRRQRSMEAEMQGLLRRDTGGGEEEEVVDPITNFPLTALMEAGKQATDFLLGEEEKRGTYIARAESVRTKTAKIHADKRTEITENETQSKLIALQKVGGGLVALSNLLGQTT